MDAKKFLNTDNVDDTANDKVNEQEHDFAPAPEDEADALKVLGDTGERVSCCPQLIKPAVIFSEKFEGRPPILIHRVDQVTEGTELVNTAEDSAPTLGPSGAQNDRQGLSFIIFSTSEEDMEIVRETLLTPNM
jgi:hypothetical protein